MYSFQSFVIISSIVLLSSCSYDVTKPDEKEEVLDSSQGFTKFFVIGDTYTSGFMDGSIYKGGQKYSYPNIIGTKFDTLFQRKVFQQPEVENESGFNEEATRDESAPRGKFKLEYRSGNSIYPQRLPTDGEPIKKWKGSYQELNNFSIPDLKSFEVADLSLLSDNQYFQRISPGNKSLLELLIEQDPSVVLVSLGQEDILSYSLTGASGRTDGVTETDLTPASLYEESLHEVIDKIINETDAHIFITNLYNILEAPYFNTIEHTLETEMYSAEYISTLSSYYDVFNNAVFQYNYIEGGGVSDEKKRPTIDFDPIGYPNVSPKQRARVVVDEELPEVELNDGTEIPQWRMAVEGEKILYKVEYQLKESSDVSGKIPLTDEQVLTQTEVDILVKRLAEFNKIISNTAISNDRVDLIDIKSVINDIKNDRYTYKGVSFSTHFSRNGIFSSDGYTLNPRGNAIIANLFIEAINEIYNAQLDFVDPNSYRGNSFSVSTE